ncbi:MAG: M36 family metallopeptidase, partial [Verrucomicrobia bacterium]|nr:M36 family metallopeptidase [Verrucomicrobiota bacterium]
MNTTCSRVSLPHLTLICFLPLGWFLASPARAETEREIAVAKLKAEVPGLRIEQGLWPGHAAWVHSTEGFLRGARDGAPTGAKNPSTGALAGGPYHAIKAFLDEEPAVFGHSADALTNAVIRRDAVSPRHGMRTTVWQQQIEGIPVFGGQVIGHTTRDGQLVSLFSGFVSDAAAKSRAAGQMEPKIPVAEAIARAAADLGEKVDVNTILPSAKVAGGVEGFQHFGAPHLKPGTYARLVWVPRPANQLDLCWEVLLTPQGQGELYRVILDAQTGEVRMRHSLSAHLRDASYRVYTNDSPTPMTPGCPAPSTNQPPEVPRTLLTLSALSTNASPAGWINDGDNETLGNNVDAHLDADGDDQPDLPRPQGSPFRVFDFPLNLATDPYWCSDAGVVNAFYWCNVAHDWFYELGFTEAWGNFQTTNFARGGVGGDAIQVDVQDGDGYNRDHIYPYPYDGMAPRIELYAYPFSPRRDSALDDEAILHEYTHGVCQRAVGGSAGLTDLQPWGLWEGWACFYPLALLSEPGDDPRATYPFSVFLSWQVGNMNLRDCYFGGGLRYPVSTDMSKNPLTLKDIDPTQASSHPGVPLNPNISPLESDPTEEHRQGEVWCVALWNARANLIDKHGAVAGNQLMLQLVYDGLTLSPPNPTFLQARDAILLADRLNTGGANQTELWQAFAQRGMGVSAHCPPSFTTTGVQEAFDLPDFLEIRPSADLFPRGLVGGPFSPTNMFYALTNRGGSSLNWSASPSQSWVSIIPASGSLAPGAGTRVEVRLGPAVNTFGKNIYTNVITFTDAATGRAQARWVVLQVGDAQPTEVFGSDDFDLANTSLTFTPDGSWTYYDVCRGPAVTFPTDPSGGTPVFLEDDACVGVQLAGGATVSLFGERADVFYIGSNGYLTFDQGDSANTQSEYWYFTSKRIAALMNDLDSSAGGSVSWKQLKDRAAVTFQEVPFFGQTNSNNFQFELFFDGRIRLTWLGMDTRTGVVGLSRGGTRVPGDFVESDLSAFAACPQP